MAGEENKPAASASGPPQRPRSGPTEEGAFDEQGYLRAYPDVAEAILRGETDSAKTHYRVYGAREGRAVPIPAEDPPGKLLTTVAPLVRPEPQATAAANGFEGLIISRNGGIMIIGWVDDFNNPMKHVRLIGHDWRLTFDAAALARIRRPDAESALGKPIVHPFGYFGLLFTNQPVDVSSPCQVEVVFKNGAMIAATVPPRLVDDEELRNIALSYLFSAQHFGNAQIKAIACLEKGLGEQVMALNREIVDRIVAAPHVERFGPTGGKPKGSIVVCLYGRPEYMFLQSALFSGLAGIEDYEFVYVSNSPELAEALLREAEIAAQIYAVPITLVILPGNAGFGAANNAAARFARSDRILIVNPDVFPKDADWARKHTELVTARPAQETRLFGAPLYYDDGALMHGGMYFELDRGVAFEGQKGVQWTLLRVEHYGKGAPHDSTPFTRPRRVPAVTGAFISVDRKWFEKLGGFSVDYVFGHYEDADLCLKSLEAGTPVWLHDIRLWHLEGKGSTRLSVHEGGSLLNRWLFTSRWGDLVSGELVGREAETRLEKVSPDARGEQTRRASDQRSEPAKPPKGTAPVADRLH